MAMKKSKFFQACKLSDNLHTMKKAIFFTIDSLLASGIVIIAILLVSSFYSAESESTNINYASRDLVRVFSAMSIGETDNGYVKSLISSGEIKNTNNTVLEQIGEFWETGKKSMSANLTKNLTEDIIPSNYGFSVLINEENVYIRNLSINNALVSSRSIISGITDTSSLWGPDIIEIRVWE